MNESLAVREAPAGYQVEPDAQRVRPGYKQTDLGIIPEDWDVIPMGQVSQCLIGLTYSPLDVRDFGTLVLRSSNVQNGRLKFDDNVFVDMEIPTRAITRENDILICVRNGSRQLIGKCALIDGKTAGSAFGAFMSVLRSHSAKFLFFEFQSNILKHQIDEVMGATINQITNKNMAAFKVIWPPTKAEQEAIAEALSDADALIESLEQLIAKKRDLKHGTMQELLTGKKRLPGFSEQWEVKPLGDLFNFSGGFSASRDQLSNDGYCYLHYGDIHKSSKTYTDVRAEYQDIPKLDMPLKRISSGSLLNDGDVVFVDASEDDEGTSKHIVVVNKDKTPYISGLHTIVAKSKTDDMDHLYKRYCFQAAAIKRQFYFFTVGTKVSGISKTNIAKVTLPVPSRLEQTAIARILSDMDTEIAALEARLTKTRELKQGMMHNLLTGAIRLI